MLPTELVVEIVADRAMRLHSIMGAKFSFDDPLYLSKGNWRCDFFPKNTVAIFGI
ncbi:hypothetical protein AB7360_09430 [Providencia alcalifaciens]|uniref:hypothetical protein n=1 Tax=Providencia TaxID=586 RepID=UPI0032D9D784